jgi:hypothetical protein
VQDVSNLGSGANVPSRCGSQGKKTEKKPDRNQLSSEDSSPTLEAQNEIGTEFRTEFQKMIGNDGKSRADN